MSQKETTHVEMCKNLLLRAKTVRGTVCLDGGSLSIADIVVLSQGSDVQVTLSEDALHDVDENEKYLKKKLKEGLVVYGINTGFGASADVRSGKMEAVQKALIRNLNSGMGPVFPTNIVRAAMVIRANSLVKGYSGVRPLVPQTLVQLLNADITPHVPVRGSISASGDLVPSSYIAAAMMGRKELGVTVHGEVKKCGEALEEAGITPLVLGPKEGLAIINAASVAAGASAITLYDANQLLLLTQVCTGLSIEALKGRTESFHPVIQACLPHIGQKEIADNMLMLLENSQMAITQLDMHLPDSCGVLKQDRYSLRSSPQWLGSVAETLLDACRIITIELNSANDNPTVDHRTENIIHGANFQGETLSITMDQTRQVLGVCGKLMFAQFSELVNSKLNYDLSPNLSGCDINLDWGFKGSDIAMASYMSELDHIVNPMSNHVLSAESHNQSVNSLALISARLTKDAVEILQMMIANLLYLAVQGIDLRQLQHLVLTEIEKLSKKHPGLEQAVKEVEWYELLFLPDEKVKIIMDKMPKTNNCTAIGDALLGNLKCLYNDVCNRRLDCTPLLGEGTRQMYSFIRRDLAVPFNYGQCELDTGLNKILSAIQTGLVQPVILSMFNSPSDRKLEQMGHGGG